MKAEYSPKFTTDELIQCVQREIALRQSLYPELVEEGSLTEPDASREVAMMTQIAERLIQIRNQKITSL